MSVIKSNVATSQFPFGTATHSKVTIIQEELNSSKKFKPDDINSVAITKVDYFSDKDKSNYSMNTGSSSDAITVLSRKAENTETNTFRESRKIKTRRETQHKTVLLFNTSAWSSTSSTTSAGSLVSSNVSAISSIKASVERIGHMIQNNFLGPKRLTFVHKISCQPILNLHFANCWSETNS